MPYRWISAPSAPEAPVAELLLWPHRSLPAHGFVVFFGISACLVALPLLAVLGSPVMWAILPFIILTFSAMWWGLRRSYADGAVLEELRLWPDRVTLSRQGPRDRQARWEANPHWVQVTLHAKGGPVDNYVTLKGAGREVEIGAFLTEDERRTLHAELLAAFARAG